jgi:hypothetical protein
VHRGSAFQDSQGREPHDRRSHKNSKRDSPIVKQLSGGCVSERPACRELTPSGIGYRESGIHGSGDSRPCKGRFPNRVIFPTKARNTWVSIVSGFRDCET